MSFTLSFVLEVLIGGCFCSIWTVLLINKIMDGTLQNLLEFASKGFSIGTLGTFLCMIAVYVLGWISQYFCDLIFDNLFEKRIKGSPFKQKSDFHLARGLVMQKGSKTVLDDIQMDRQLLRLSKLLALNFILIGLIGMLYVKENPIFCIISLTISTIVSVISFLQWKKRYVSVMYKFFRAAESIRLTDTVKGDEAEEQSELIVLQSK